MIVGSELVQNRGLNEGLLTDHFPTLFDIKPTISDRQTTCFRGEWVEMGRFDLILDALDCQRTVRL